MKTIITALAIMTFASTSYSAIYRAIVTDIIDGDTITAKISGKEKTFELAHVDCPELNQPFGDQAAEFVRKKTNGKEVAISTRGKAKTGATIAEIITIPGGKNLSYLLVKEGLAWANPQKAPKPISKLEQQARKQKAGLWAQERPVPPWAVRPEEQHEIVKFAHLLESPEKSNSILAQSTTTLLANKASQYITAKDYEITSSVRQSGDYVIISGRISNGPVCKNLKVSAYAKSDKGRTASISDVVSMSQGIKSTLFEGKAHRSYYDTSQAKPKWEITSVYISCR